MPGRPTSSSEPSPPLRPVQLPPRRPRTSRRSEPTLAAPPLTRAAPGCAACRMRALATPSSASVRPDQPSVPRSCAEPLRSASRTPGTAGFAMP